MYETMDAKITKRLTHQMAPLGTLMTKRLAKIDCGQRHVRCWMLLTMISQRNPVSSDHGIMGWVGRIEPGGTDNPIDFPSSPPTVLR